jgi:hypothetical protein
MNSLRTGELSVSRRGRVATVYATLLAGLVCVAAPVRAHAVAPSFAFSYGSATDVPFSWRTP